MKVLFVNHATGLGGAELTLVELLRHRPKGIDATVAVPAEGPITGKLREIGIPIVIAGPGESVLAMRRTSSPKITDSIFAAASMGPSTARLAKLMRRFDLVVTNSTKAHVYGTAAAKLAQKKVIWRLHDVVDGEGFKRSVKALLDFAARGTHRIVTVSEASARPIRGAANVVVAFNGVTPQIVNDRPATRAQIRLELGISADAPVALMLGRITPMKGADVLLAAMRTLPSLHAILAGDATYSEDPSFAARLRDTAASLGARVHFTGFRTDVGALLAASDVLVHPSTKPDSLPTSILEALGSGVPVVASTAGGAVEILSGERGGLLVVPGDPVGLATAIDAVISDEAKRAHLIAQGARRFEDFRAEVAWPRVWDAILADKPGPSGTAASAS